MNVRARIPCKNGWLSGRPCHDCDCGAESLPPAPVPLRCKGDTLLPCLACPPGCPWYASPSEQREELSRDAAEPDLDEAWDDPAPWAVEVEPEPTREPAPVLLDPYQQAAVEHEGGPALCTAGAGSGKTRVLTERVARLCYRGLARPDQILGVTFSRKAAGELRERVAVRLGHDAAKKVCLSTFHALGLSLCREFAHKIGRGKGLTIWDDRSAKSEMALAWSEVMQGQPEPVQASLGKRYPRPPTRALLKHLSNIKCEPVPIEEGMAALMEGGGEDRFAFMSALLQYEESKRACNALDYDDLIWATARLLMADEEACAEIQARWLFVLVDEYQDTSRVQALMMKQIAGPHRNIFVVGDDDQAIYRWRGAEPTNLLDFESDWPGAQIYPLGLNYRSTPDIVDWAAKSIAINIERRGKKIWSESKRGAKVEAASSYDARAEADRAIAWLRQALEEDGREPRDGAVLVRTRRQLLTMQAAAVRAQVPSALVGALSWHQRADARLVLGWMRYLVNPRDLEAGATVLRNWPGVGTKTVSLWRAEASVYAGPCLGAPLSKASREARQKASREAMVRLGETLVLVGGAGREGMLPLISMLYERTGLHGAINAQRESADPADALDVAAREEVHETFVALSSRYGGGTFGIQSFLDDVVTMASQEREQDACGGRITISTIHASKGLEWHAVVVAGVAEGLLPFARSAAQAEDDDDVDGTGHVEDERRLYYVACTRAKQRLLLTYPMTLPIPGKPPVVVSPSRFLAESRPEPEQPDEPKPSRKWSRKT